MSESERPDLEPFAKLRDQMLAQLEADGEAGQMEGLDLERLRDAMHRPKALETMAELMSSGSGKANPGDPAPDFELPYLSRPAGQEGETVQLSSHFGSRPVALIFGSYT